MTSGDGSGPGRRGPTGPGLAYERTALAWRRTALAAGAVVLLTVNLAVRLGQGPLAVSALIAGVPFVALAYRGNIRVLRMNATAGRAPATCAALTVAYAVLGVALLLAT